MLRWGLAKNDSANCGAEQMAYHITSRRCPIYHSSEGMHGLIELDLNTRAPNWTYGLFEGKHKNSLNHFFVSPKMG